LIDNSFNSPASRMTKLNDLDANYRLLTSGLHPTERIEYCSRLIDIIERRLTTALDHDARVDYDRVRVAAIREKTILMTAQ